MTRYKLKNGGRKKALFGAEAAAILAAAGINVAGTLAAASMGANATKNAAKSQADATIKAANKQAEVLKSQNQNAKEIQEMSQEFTRTQNEENRDLQKDIQMNLQMLTGKQTVNDKLEAAKIQAKNGSSVRKKLAQQKSNTLLRGSYNRNDTPFNLLSGSYNKTNMPFPLLRRSYNRNNMPFTVTDGGGVIPLWVTPEGYDLYEIIGNDHEHSHKVQGGKRKTGVGFKFPGNVKMEGQGNQNTKLGELLLVTPYDAKFISKNYIDGFNPALATLSGMHPLLSFNIQEIKKEQIGLDDSGKENNINYETNPYYSMAKYGTSIRKKLSNDRRPEALKGLDDNSKINNKRSIKFAGGSSILNNETTAISNVPDFSVDTIAPTATGVAYIIQNNAETNENNVNYGTKSDYSVAKYCTSVRKKLACGGRPKANNGGWYLTGAGINTLGNLGGAWITQHGNNEAMRYISAANTQAAGLLADAYSQMTGIDLNSIRKENYAATHAMAVDRAPIVNINPELAQIERARQRQVDAINKNTLSIADRLNRLSRVESDSYDQRSIVYGKGKEQSESIKQGNVERRTQIDNENANRDSQATKEWAKDYWNTLMYNNNIKNEKRAGIAQAQANALTGNAQIAASTSQANAQSWASAIANSAQGVGNAIESNIKTEADRRNVLIGADAEQQYRAAMLDGSRSEAQALYDSWKNGTDEQQKWAANLDAKWNGRLSGTKSNRISLKTIS